MRTLKLSSFVVFALAVAAVWQVSSGAEASAPASAVDYVRERPSRCAGKSSSVLSAMSTPEEGRSSAQGPRKIEESGAAPGMWGKCSDCSDCLSSRDCEHVGSFCYEFCP
ncbi:hypothetical protein [Pyxidicoccus trucidator]|uniref:hypothetical protein n=1 Tax=Pyxidicoccus trucidator TaxID=2709662 RepID=UPI0013DC94F8|nr:hypothetical protein [Pyxidicoccus trucidator]